MLQIWPSHTIAWRVFLVVKPKIAQAKAIRARTSTATRPSACPPLCLSVTNMISTIKIDLKKMSGCWHRKSTIASRSARGLSQVM
uniref:Putative secreted protein n=1 Tax=Anopheles darlingi TaxID=43151 RepID=A0A2M4DQ78_ANODA